MGDTSVTSAGNIPALPEWAGEEIFRFLEDRFGAKFIDSLGGLPRERVMLAWREELIGYTPREIKRGLQACRGRAWPPTCMEFLILCRPMAAAKTEWVEAREQMAIRLRGQGGDVWSRPQVYWAAVAIGGYDLQTQGWEPVRARWEYALANAKCESVPNFVAPQLALSSPGAQCMTREEVRRRLPEIADRIVVQKNRERGPAEVGKNWAVELMRREAAGESIPLMSRRFWRAALALDPDVPAADAVAKFEGMSA